MQAVVYVHVCIAAEMNRQDKVVEVMQERQEKDAKQLKKELTDYWKENQRMQDRKEFDLNDPDYKKKGLPARVSFSLYLQVLKV